MRRFTDLSFVLLAATVGGVSLFAQSASTQIQGRWDATFVLDQTAIPFRLDISGEGATLAGILYNGDLKLTTTSTAYEDGNVTLNFDQYPVHIAATLNNGQLAGTIDGHFGPQHGVISYPLTARRHVDAPAAALSDVPSIAGTWEIEHESAKGEKAWRFVVHQNGADVSASILRIDGDTGALVGRYRDGKFELSHFDGSRPIVAEVVTQPDGSLRIQLHGGFVPTEPLIAWRPNTARAKQLPEPTDFFTNTRVRDVNEPFSFRFPDVNGKLVSSDDAQFRGKPYLVVVTGTWCPNCHDEAPYLVQLYNTYHSKGLEIVALDFEEPEQQDLRRARAFIKKYNIPYTFLIAGAPAELHEKVPQAVNLDTWPATFFVGKDGRVREIHSGFAAPASGEFNAELRSEFTSEIESLLKEKSVPVQTSAQKSANGGN
jgi:thiol-disulfide isomerase/thioredoxin